MDPMETDDTVYVPDTPDRLSKQMIDERNGVKGKSHISPTSLHSVQRKFLHEGTEINPLVIDSGSRILPSRPPKFTSSSSNSQNPVNSSSSKNAPLFRKGITNNTHIHKNRPTESELFKPAFGRNSIQVGVPGTGRPGIGKRSALANVPSSSSNGKEKVEFDENIQNKPAVSRQKRLVRNGCISPINIAKGKQLSVKEGVSGISHDSDDFKTSNGQPVSITIRELVAEEVSRNGKGKGVINHPGSSKDANNKHLVNRSSVSFNEKGKGKSIEEIDGWRSTRNRTKKVNVSPNNEEMCPIQHQDHRTARIEKGKDPNLSLRPTVSHHRARLGSSSNGHQSAASSTLIKRRKPVGSTLSGYGECSSSVPNDQEVVFRSSSNSRSNSSNNVHNLEPIIELDEFSPELRRNSVDEEARSRQVEADEAMARELQEQLYSEGPAPGVLEADEYVALSLQNRDDTHRYFASASPPVSELLRDSLIPNTRRPSHARSVSNISRRVSQSRSSPSERMTRLRSSFPGRPRTLLTSRGRASIFPENMDIDMRMHILGALEAVNDNGVVSGILEAQRDFNESDYETLLALDENNDAHGGAPTHRINSLPQSTVQNNNFDEVCAVCLETPAIGDTIRHLPCFHKFHKDCIDPWLKRKTSCPICKSSIT